MPCFVGVKIIIKFLQLLQIIIKFYNSHLLNSPIDTNNVTPNNLCFPESCSGWVSRVNRLLPTTLSQLGASNRLIPELLLILFLCFLQHSASQRSVIVLIGRQKRVILCEGRWGVDQVREWIKDCRMFLNGVFELAWRRSILMALCLERIRVAAQMQVSPQRKVSAVLSISSYSLTITSELPPSQYFPSRHRLLSCTVHPLYKMEDHPRRRTKLCFEVEWEVLKKAKLQFCRYRSNKQKKRLLFSSFIGGKMLVFIIFPIQELCYFSHRWLTIGTVIDEGRPLSRAF